MSSSGKAAGGTTLNKSRVTYTGGDLTAPNTSAWASIGCGDITVALTAGTWVIGGFKAGCSSLVGARSFDIHTKPGGVLTNQFSTATATSNTASHGLQRSKVAAGQTELWNGSMIYQIVAGDIAGGNVIFSLTTFGGSSDVIIGQANFPIDFWIVTIGS